MSCLAVTFTKQGEALNATFALVCNTSVGENRLYTVNGDFLLTVEGEYLIVN